jgi:hypothetical protein
LVNASGAEQIDDERMRCEISVRVEREPANEFSQTAVRVISATGETLGHIPEELCAAYWRALAAAGTTFVVACGACVFGRLRNEGWNMGIWLALPPADDLGRTIERLVSTPATGR